ncbi:phosphatase PAP2 family protein [Tellurirhabdus bombi]|uniref:phosphatase PAP2 family protein n=1 Tax=Tellurirhabdus bombi TaxID=2907205 RepID=UPI001F3C9068|nr:phosphatase PAP2 family protein [Tellurirhabdus bombi]
MKTSFRTISLWATVAIFVSFLLYACNEKVVEQENFDPTAPSVVSKDGGNWKTFLVPTQHAAAAIAAPTSVNSDAYKKEVDEVVQLQKTLTESQKEAIRYWNGGAVLRWNQIMRELVAKYNLPPYQKEDGTYPAPDAANPLAYPFFPFANPPYAARAYGYISIAQYDALVAAWKHKFAHNRPALTKTASTVTALVPLNADLPSYPSEDAVLASVTLEMMKVMFPGEVVYLQAKADEQKAAALWAGKAVRSDIEAGDALGKTIAAQFVARAKTDNAGKAGGNKSVWDGFATKIKAQGERPWISLETPARPPMLPVFGEVKSFVLSAADIAKLRPGPPPSTNSEQMKKEADEVLSYAQSLTREQTRIVHFWADGAGTYTPPGHWNAIAAEMIWKAKMNDLEAAKVFAMLGSAEFDAAICCWEAKYYYFNPRPSTINPKIKTATGVPNFPAYTSGHSTFSGAAATVLGGLFPAEKDRLMNMAQEASMSRLYGGIHFRSDCEVGLKCGIAIGQETLKWSAQ